MAAASDLTTLARVKRYLKIDVGSTTDDALLGDLITSMSGWFELQIHRVVKSRQYTELYSYPKDVTLSGRTMAVVLHNLPVISIDAVTLDGLPVVARATLDGDGYVVVNERLVIVGSPYVGSYSWYPNVNNISVLYTAGFAAVPPEIEQAVVELTAWRYKEQDRIGQAAKTTGQETISFMPFAAPLSVTTVIDQYRRINV